MKQRQYVKCNKCGFDIIVNQISRHYKYCTGHGPRRIVKTLKLKHYCRFCGLESDKPLYSHTVFCLKNPKRDSHIANLKSSCKGWHHTETTKEWLRNHALNSKHRRLVRSVRDYTMKNGEIISLDSSWEEELAKRLDFLNVKWIRPKDPMNWIDKLGKVHHYFPDFYLPEFNIYLDPKNPQVLSVQKEKIDFILKNYPNVRLIKTLEECRSWAYRSMDRT